MLQIPFDTSKEGFGANSNRKNGKTTHGIIELYPDFQVPCCLSLDIRGPAGAYRGSAIIDKETARRVGAELLNWAAGDVVHRAAGNLILTNNERAATGEKAVMAVFKEDIESGGIDLTTGIYDLVADLLHLARENDIEPDYIIHMAQTHFDAEVEKESEEKTALYCDACAHERDLPHPLKHRIYGICPLCNEGERMVNRNI